MQNISQQLCKPRTLNVQYMVLALVVLAIVGYQWNRENSSPKKQSENSSPKKQSVTHPLYPRLTHKLPSVCSNENCKADYIKYLQRQDLFPIPAIRHIVWRNETVSEHMAKQLRSWVRIHPNWTFVLWRDQDLELFVAAYFPALLQKFKSLPQQIMRVDFVRYMLLFKYGGVYADMDYTLVKNIDEFRHFHAVVTREPENHSFHSFPSWPLKPLPNIAFMMSAPGHMLFHYAIPQLKNRAPNSPTHYAGPFAMFEIMDSYQSHFPIVNNVMESVYVPPSFSFYPYLNNRLSTSKSFYVPTRVAVSKGICASIMSGKDARMMQMKQVKNLTDYCRDVNNMDPITDKSQPVYAIHDMIKTGDIYYGHGTKFYVDKPMDIRKVISNVILGKDFL